MLHLRVLGGLSLEKDGSAVEGPAAQRKRLALLAMLACSGDRGVSRERLLAVFWPESESERARGSLKQSLYALRRELGDFEIVLGSTELRLNGGVIQCDAQLFERALADRDLEHAVTLYSGPLLDGVHVDDAPEFEHWLDSERDRLSALNRSALQALAVCASERGDHVRAVEWWKCLVRVDPLSAAAATGLMRALVSIGDSPAALQHARIHEQVIRNELDTAPDPTVTALVSAIRENSDKRARQGTAPRLRTPAAENTTTDERVASVAVRTPIERRWRRNLTTAIAVGTVALAAAVWRPRPAVQVDPLSIVVLPPLNTSLDSSSDYLIDVIHRELIAELARTPALRIRSEYSAAQYRNRTKPLTEVAGELGVAIVVDGSAGIAGDSVHVRLELIQTTPVERHLAVVQDSADRGGLAGLVPRLAGRIAAQVLPGEMTTASLTRAARGSAQTVDAEAYDAFANGRMAWSRMLADSIYKAIELYQVAIARDSTFARAYSALAEAYGFLPYYAPVESRNAFPKAKEAARKAIMLDSASGEAYAALGWATLVYDHDWPTAEALMRRALELSPGYGVARMSYAWLLTSRGRFDDAIQQDRIALADDPLSLRIMAHFGIVYDFSRQHDRAIAQYRRTLARDSGFVRARIDLGTAYLRHGDYQDAIEHLTKAISASSPRAGGAVNPRTYLAEALAKAGNQDSARTILRTLLAERETRYIPPLNIGRIFAALGDTGMAFRWFERAYEERDPDLILLDVNPSYDAVREDPRFRNLLQKVGFHR